MRAYSYINALLCTMLFLSCGEEWHDNYGVDAKPISTFLEDHELKERPHLKIRHSAFSRDFLLYGTFIPMLNSPTGYSLKGRIIRFQVFADRVLMLESPKGHTISNDSDNMILLAEFPVVQVESDGIVIDFARGMNSAFTTRNVHSHGLSDKDLGTTDQFKAIFLSASFVKNIVAKGDVLTITQVAQWRNQKSELISAEFRYFFREYRPSPTFEKTYFGKHRWVQYFSTPPMVEPPTTESVAYIAKWDLSQPIVFYISENTPKEYRAAITDGLLFWNHIFGREVVIVRDLDSGLSAPDPRLNILQWVTWDNEASAYADMVVDHLTGETLQAQIYVRSGWVMQSTKKLRNQLEQLLVLDEPEEGINSIDEGVPMPTMFELSDPCIKAMGNFSEIADLAHNLSTSGINQETITVLTGDILRAVISHEMGHVLGLRHNLAGSTHGTMSLIERDTMLKTYLRTGQYQFSHDKFISQSIMDVFSAADDALVGAQIRELMHEDNLADSRLRTIYEYDKQAIDFGYFNKPMLGNVTFCSDDDMSKLQDCRRWDLSSTPILYTAARLNNMFTEVAIVLADTFASAIDPDRKGGQLTLRDLPLTNEGVLKVTDRYVKDLLLWFNQKARSGRIETNFSAWGPQNAEEITAARFKSQREQIEQLGVEKALFALLPPFKNVSSYTEQLVQTFGNHLAMRASELEAVHRNFHMSTAQLDDANKLAEAFFKHLNTEVATLIMDIIARAQFDDLAFQLPIEENIGKVANEVILAIDHEATSLQPSTLPKFTYSQKMREAAALMLNPSLGLLPDWSFDNLANIANALKQLMRRYVATDSTAIDFSTMSRERRQWFFEQNRLLNTLMRVKTLSRPKNATSPAESAKKPE